MRRAALYVCGRVVVGKSHMDALQQIPQDERDYDRMLSGFLDPETHEFTTDEDEALFYDKSIYLVRHATPEDYSASDPDITDEGLDQADHVAQSLSREDLSDFVGITSPLLRCLRTASRIEKNLGIPFRVVPEVMETPFLEEGEIFKLHNRSQQFPQFDWPTSKEWHVLPETHEDFYGRVKDILQMLPPKCIVVTHQRFICLMVDLSLCKERDTFLTKVGVPPASITLIHRQDVQRL